MTFRTMTTHTPDQAQIQTSDWFFPEEPVAGLPTKTIIDTPTYEFYDSDSYVGSVTEEIFNLRDYFASSHRIPDFTEVYAMGGDDEVYGSNINDRVFAGNGNDRVFGFYGDDKLTGGHGNDQLYGGAGRDFLDGQDGNDILTGGQGNDVLTGGVGADNFVFSEGKDVVNDFNFFEGDRIDLSGFQGVVSVQEVRDSSGTVHTAVSKSADNFMAFRAKSGLEIVAGLEDNEGLSIRASNFNMPRSGEFSAEDTLAAEDIISSMVVTDELAF